MKWLLVACIRSYRALPHRLKRRCLFKETCSSFVERVTLESGLRSGLSAVKTRASKCRPGYSPYYDYRIGEWRVRLRDGSVLSSPVLADFVLEPYHTLMKAAGSGSYFAKRSDENKVILCAHISILT